MKSTCALVLVMLVAAVPAEAQRGRGGGGRAGGPPSTVGADGAPSLKALVTAQKQASDFRVVMTRFDQDLQQIRARYDIPLSPVRIGRERRHFTGWLAQVNAFDVKTLNAAGQADYAALRTRLETELKALDTQERLVDDMRPLLPFVRPLQQLQEARRDRLDVNGQKAAQTLEDARKVVLRLTESVGASPRTGALQPVTPATAKAAVDYLRNGLRQPLQSWYQYYFGFDPLFTWWVRVPYAELNTALDAYAAAIEKAWGTDRIGA